MKDFLRSIREKFSNTKQPTVPMLSLEITSNDNISAPKGTPTQERNTNAITNREVITRRGGRLPISDELRQFCAILDDGTFYVDQDNQDNKYVEAIPDTAFHLLGLQLSDPIPKEQSFIREIYGDTASATTFSTEARAEVLKLIRQASERRASDIQITFVGETASVAFHINGFKTEKITSFPKRFAEAFFNAAFYLSDYGDTLLQTVGNLQAAIVEPAVLPKNVDGIRMQFVRLANGRHLNMRLLYASSLIASSGLNGLGFTSTQLKLMRAALVSTGGLITNAAPTENGKSTTLNMLLSELIDSNADRITVVAVDDPPEGIDPRVLQFAVSKGFSENAEDPFYVALQASLRVAPHAVKIGECRTKATAETAASAVYTGKLILTTLHTGSALKIPERYAFLGLSRQHAFDPELHRLWISQRLVPTLCPKCRQPAKDAPVDSIIHKLEEEYSKVIGSGAVFYTAGPGCDHCKGIGSKPGLYGRTLIAEVIEPTNFLLSLLQINHSAARAHWISVSKGESIPLLGVDKLVTAEIGLLEYSQFIATPSELEFDLVAEASPQSISPVTPLQIKEGNRNEHL